MLPDAVRERFPWPEVPDEIEPWVANMDGGGRTLIDPIIEHHKITTMLEIGSFLGGSTLRWLSISPRLDLVAVDPWTDANVGDFVASQEGWFPWRKPDALIVQQLNKPEGFYHTFLSNLRVYRDRLVPVRGREEKLDELHALGLRPHVIYIDAYKQRKELDICRRLWPEAILTGDDYWWRNAQGGCPMQEHVHRFAREHGLRVLHRRHTWVLASTRVAWFWRWVDRLRPSDEPGA